MRKFLWGSVLAVFLVSSVALGVSDDLNSALQLLKTKFLFMAQKMMVKVPAQYLFGQQVNGTCMLWPWVNLKILEDLSVKYNDPSLIPSDFWYSKREWFGFEDEYLRNWNKAYQTVVLSEKKFFDDALEEGPVFPNLFDSQKRPFYAYDKNGSPLGKLDLNTFTINVEGSHVLDLIKRLMSVPYFFAERGATESIKIAIQGGKTIEYKKSDPIGYPGVFFPWGHDEKGWHYFDINKKEYVDMQESECKSIAINKFSPKAFEIYQPSKDETAGELLGFDKIGYDSSADVLAHTFEADMGGGIKQLICFSIYTTGLYKLVLLRLGLDSNNNEVTEENNSEGLWSVISAMRTEFNKGDKYKNPWSDYYMSKETLLEYHLAEIFKKLENGLFDEAKKVCDFFFQTWEVYQKMINGPVLGKGGNPGDAYDSDTIKKYLPGPEQMMAMIVMRNVIGLWWGAMNPKAFYKALGIDNVGGDFKKDFVDKAGPFIDFWQKVVNELKKLPQKHFASFTSHGWVVSFDDDLIKLQNAQPVDNLGLLEKLGIAGIESWHSKDLPTFYKRGVKKE